MIIIYIFLLFSIKYKFNFPLLNINCFIKNKLNGEEAVVHKKYDYNFILLFIKNKQLLCIKRMIIILNIPLFSLKYIFEVNLCKM